MLRDLFPSSSKIPQTLGHTLTSLLTREFHRRGHEVTIFALSRGVTETILIPGNGIRAYICPQRRPRFQMLDFFKGERNALADAMRRSGCDILHAFWTYEFASAVLQTDLPHVVTAEDIPTVVLRFAKHPYWMEKPLLAWRVLQNAKCITTVSPYAALALRRFTKGHREVRVVPNPVSPSAYALHDRHSQRDPASPFTFASVLNEWDGRKNGKRLLEAFGLLRRQYSDRVRLLMLGHCHEAAGPAETWAIAHGLRGGVHFLGNVPYREVLTTLAESTDALVHPSFEETFGMVLAEAMAIGLPVIGGSRSGAVPWVLSNGETGLLTEIGSAESIASAMSTLIEDARLRVRLAESGREKALRDFQAEAIVAQYEDVLQTAQREQLP
jgi:glycosyltransferase involved in cell wall biosynthesis